MPVAATTIQTRKIQSRRSPAASSSLVLSTYDRDGCDLILVVQFTSALRILGFAPTERDVALLLEFYGDRTTDRFVNWRDIVDIASMRELISNSDRALSFVGSVALRERRPVPAGLAAPSGRTCRSLMECEFNPTDELLRLDGLKRGTAAQTEFRQLFRCCR
jgi:hypothetical protein